MPFLRAVHREPSIAASSSCNHPSQAVHRFIAKPTSALLPGCPLPSSLLPSRPALYRRAVYHELSSIASCPSRHHRALHCNIAEPSSALSPNAKPSIAPSCQSQAVYYQAIHFTELSIASCPSLHRLAVHHSIAMPFLQAVHREPSIAASSSCHRPSRAVNRFIPKLSSA